jgi:hypothetical protein
MKGVLDQSVWLGYGLNFRRIMFIDFLQGKKFISSLREHTGCETPQPAI